MSLEDNLLDLVIKQLSFSNATKMKLKSSAVNDYFEQKPYINRCFLTSGVYTIVLEIDGIIVASKQLVVIH